MSAHSLIRFVNCLFDEENPRKTRRERRDAFERRRSDRVARTSTSAVLFKVRYFAMSTMDPPPVPGKRKARDDDAAPSTKRARPSTATPEEKRASDAVEAVPAWKLKRMLYKVQTAEKQVTSKWELLMKAQARLEEIDRKARTTAGANAKVQRKIMSSRAAAQQRVEKARQAFAEAEKRLKQMMSERENAATTLAAEKITHDEEARRIETEEENRKRSLLKSKECKSGRASWIVLSKDDRNFVSAALKKMTQEESAKASDVLTYTDVDEREYEEVVLSRPETIVVKDNTTAKRFSNERAVEVAKRLGETLSLKFSSSSVVEYVDRASDELLRFVLEEASKFARSSAQTDANLPLRVEGRDVFRALSVGSDELRALAERVSQSLS